MFADEDAALLAVNNALGNPFYWASHNHCDGSWSGITCTSNVVTGMQLPSKFLWGGTIAPEISVLTSLTMLSMQALFDYTRSNAPPHGSIELFSTLTNLVHLNLYFNGFSGSIPAQFSLLIHLEKLNLHSNQLSGEVPAELATLTALAFLDLDFNSLSGVLLPALSTVYSRGSLSCIGNSALCVPTSYFPGIDTDRTLVGHGCMSQGEHVDGSP